MFANLFLFITAFIVIWLGSGLIVNSIERFAKKQKIASFFISFVILGLFITAPEFGVGVSSLIQNDPSIFTGNLIGGGLGMFLFVIPILAVAAGGIKLQLQLNKKLMPFLLFVVGLPVLTIMGGMILFLGGVLLILVYLVTLYLVSNHYGFDKEQREDIVDPDNKNTREVAWKVGLGLVSVMFASHVIVENTVILAETFGLSTFYLSLFLLAVGVNLPEIFIGLRSVLLGQKEIAIGGIIGSAIADSMLFGVFSVLSYILGTDLIVNINFTPILIFTIFGLSVFYLFTRSKDEMSRLEGFMMLGIYGLFILALIWWENLVEILSRIFGVWI